MTFNHNRKILLIKNRKSENRVEASLLAHVSSLVAEYNINGAGTYSSLLTIHDSLPGIIDCVKLSYANYWSDSCIIRTSINWEDCSVFVYGNDGLFFTLCMAASNS